MARFCGLYDTPEPHRTEIEEALRAAGFPPDDADRVVVVDGDVGPSRSPSGWPTKPWYVVRVGRDWLTRSQGT